MTQHAIFPDSIKITSASGLYLYSEDGRAIMDGISSWWINTFGHCHPKMVSAVQHQAAELEQVIFAGFTHHPAEQLTDRLLSVVHRHLGDHLNYVFYSDSGSTAVEVALKMAIGHFEHRGQQRRTIVALEGGYHGDTFGTMSAGERSIYNDIYQPYLFEVSYLPFPESAVEAEDSKTVRHFRALLEQQGNDVAALILEPLIQGAGGMRIYSAGLLRSLHELCQQYGVLLIADEVMTAFGRTGTLFACEQAGISPDLLCLSKGLTGGFLAMGATLASEDIYESFYDTDRSKTFFHSSSFTGNPLACAAAVASLDIWEQEPIMEHVSRIQRRHQSAIRQLQYYPGISNVRVQGTILALEIAGSDSNYLSAIGPQLYRFYLNQNILLRPLGNCVYVLPPYCINDNELESIYDCIARSADHIRNGICQ
ncbi:adenosylmethionine--8-amino-7-oxononanoate transaminase [Gynuella sunshinyii]|uniref:Adenosylmethionine-8-amino-7-oxononanoate aminotransferase n=1 Tax=Gynuella sunshinyii YC6258 TaxID=1445510 RepID=A0A0C5VDB2_9GAMM|nr:adenosylmethionine--8-amino-7-oxononanoate transaminase [Gynuella sunshinyii]AJQ97310.1 adenosylmethionine-8-amino-7-oxononanoate aminotransferase [Gynuella sunshinyii YC6258]